MASRGRQLWYPASVVLVAGRHQLGCLLRSGPWSLKPAVVSGRSAHPGLAAPSCIGVVERRRTVTQAAESVKMQAYSGNQVLFAQQQTISQRTQNPHAHA